MSDGVSGFVSGCVSVWVSRVCRGVTRTRILATRIIIATDELT